MVILRDGNIFDGEKYYDDDDDAINILTSDTFLSLYILWAMVTDDGSFDSIAINVSVR